MGLGGQTYFSIHCLSSLLGNFTEGIPENLAKELETNKCEKLSSQEIGFAFR